MTQMEADDCTSLDLEVCGDPYVRTKDGHPCKKVKGRTEGDGKEVCVEKYKNSAPPNTHSPGSGGVKANTPAGGATTPKPGSITIVDLDTGRTSTRPLTDLDPSNAEPAAPAIPWDEALPLCYLTGSWKAPQVAAQARADPLDTCEYQFGISRPGNCRRNYSEGGNRCEPVTCESLKNEQDCVEAAVDWDLFAGSSGSERVRKPRSCDWHENSNSCTKPPKGTKFLIRVEKCADVRVRDCGKNPLVRDKDGNPCKKWGDLQSEMSKRIVGSFVVLQLNLNFQTILALSAGSDEDGQNTAIVTILT